LVVGVEATVTGTEWDRAFRLEGGFRDEGVRMNLETLEGVPSSPFDFLDGEARAAGSTFSESELSPRSTGRRRLVGALEGALSGVDWFRTGRHVSGRLLSKRAVGTDRCFDDS
jgi:hypothetical protein